MFSTVQGSGAHGLRRQKLLRQFMQSRRPGSSEPYTSALRLCQKDSASLCGAPVDPVLFNAEPHFLCACTKFQSLPNLCRLFSARTDHPRSGAPVRRDTKRNPLFPLVTASGDFSPGPQHVLWTCFDHTVKSTDMSQNLLVFGQVKMKIDRLSKTNVKFLK